MGEAAASRLKGDQVERDAVIAAAERIDPAIARTYEG
jgi:hypothetical protein